jgi:hypothetical protein
VHHHGSKCGRLGRLEVAVPGTCARTDSTTLSVRDLPCFFGPRLT